jgi:hypothetical protein
MIHHWYVFNVAGGSVSWDSKKQPTVALSTVEAEYMAASNATKEAIWLHVLLEDLGFPQTQATTIHDDSKGCIALSRGTVLHSRTEHIMIYQLPREAFERLRATIGVGEYW